MLTWGAGTWGLFAGFLAVLVAGIALGAYGLARPGAGPGTAHDILAERLARGEISPEEYEQRLAVLGPGGGGISSAAKPLAVALVAAGLIGSLVVAAVGPGSGGGFMRTMMNGGMGQMMGGGQPGRAASPPVQGAQEIRVTAREFSFSPDELHIKEGAMVNVVVD